MRIGIRGWLMGGITTLWCSLAAAGSAPAHTSWPLVIDNCGHQVTLDRPPERVVTLGQHETELFLALGLDDRMAGTGVWFGPLPERLATRGRDIPRLSDNAPSLEAVAARRPDFVAAQYTYHLGPHGEVATRHQFEELGIATWVSPSDCIGKQVTDTSNSDGARVRPFTMAQILLEIRQLARIFDVPARGEALGRALEERIRKARQQAASLPEKAPLKVVYWFSSPRLQGDAWVAGNMGAPAWINRELHLENVIDSTQEWPTVSWERIAAADPDIIVLADMERRLYPADDIAQKLAFLRADPVTRELRAVRNNHVVIVPAQSLNPSLRVVDALERISQALPDIAPAS
ncbi:ABC transporter substrate-binding protein [Larsenimonas rhizosphaerae]|uniref:ABC transporter substrate-binding protein n=1 Tax=Larsenimonas rhizosphaerae TaxID=2944682 RepID=UPI0020332D6A|nr:ABC transporter substrate-binding protein [Larsenimonas rhizosphaerae]MCM2130617.1 ABC transporter substrate-binding protein [Larsenimonas rhizosphaerae]